MTQKCILVFGPTISYDKNLIDALKECGSVKTIEDKSEIESIIRKNKVGLMLLEITSENTSELKLIKKITKEFKNLKIILIDGNGKNELIARAFQYGIVDAFRKPYKGELIVERVRAILK